MSQAGAAAATAHASAPFALQHLAPEGGVVLTAGSATFPYLAVATRTPTVEVRTLEGAEVCPAIECGTVASKLAWQPNGSLLAIGLSCGTVTLVRVTGADGTGATRFIDQAAHYTAPSASAAAAAAAPVASQVSSAAPMGPDAQFPTKITMLQWSPDGTRLLTGDSSGTVVLWRVEPSGRHTLMHTYRRSTVGVPTRAVFLTYPGSTSSGVQVQPATLSIAYPWPRIANVPPMYPGGSAFLYAGENGLLCYASDASPATIDVVPSLGSPIDGLEAMVAPHPLRLRGVANAAALAAAAASGIPSLGHVRVVVMTRHQALIILHIDCTTGAVFGVTRAKMSLRQSTTAVPLWGVHSAAWVGPGLLATAAKDDASVLCWEVGEVGYVSHDPTKPAPVVTASTLTSDGFPSVPVPAHALTTSGWDALGRSGSGGGAAGGFGGAGASQSKCFTLETGPSPVGGVDGSPLLDPAAILVAEGRRLTGMAFSGPEALLSAATNDGHVFCWRRTAAAGWEAVADLTFPVTTAGVAATAAAGTLAVRLGDGRLLAVTRVVRRRRCVGGNALIQTGLREAVLEVKAASPSADGAGASHTAYRLKLDVDGPAIKGFDLSDTHALVWTGAKAFVFAVPAPAAAPDAGLPAAPALAPTAAFFTPATSMALVKEGVFAGIEPAGLPLPSGAKAPTIACGVVVYTLGGTVKHTLPFADRDGAPRCLSSNGRHACVASSTGRIRVYDTARAEPKLVSEGTFEDARTGRPLGAIVSAAVNADGSRVAVLGMRAAQVGVSAEYVASAGASAATAAATATAAAAAGGAWAAATTGAQPLDSRLWVYSCEADSLAYYDTGAARLPSHVAWDREDARLLALQSVKLTPAPVGPAGVGAAEGQAAAGGSSAAPAPAAASASASGAEATDEEPLTEVVTLFAPAEGDGQVGAAATGGASAKGGKASPASAALAAAAASAWARLVVLDSFALDRPVADLAGIAAPDVYLLLDAAGLPPATPATQPRTMRDFVGLDAADKATTAALLNFAYHMAVGNVDAAYTAVKTVASAVPNVWENMAEMCVKTQRLDVAKVCVGQLGHARAARALAQGAAEPQLEARVGMLAVQLGLFQDAARLFQSAGRTDLLTQLYQDSGQWQRAIAAAAHHDRVAVRPTHYAFARHLEACGDTVGALHEYEAASAHRNEVTRMLVAAGDWAGLNAYITTQDDPSLYRWYAQYLEAQGEEDEALRYYQQARDTLALVRIACARGDVAGAEAILKEHEAVAAEAAAAGSAEGGGSGEGANLSGSGAARPAPFSSIPAAAYHLARHLEHQSGAPRDAIAYYEKAGRYNHAVRLARATGADSELMRLALSAGRVTQLEVARHMEASGQASRAALLYRRAGAFSKALDLCFRAELYDELQAVAEALSAAAASGAAGVAADPALLSRCADFLLSHRQYERAVNLLVQAGRGSEAIAVCAAQNIFVTEALAEAMTPPKPDEEALLAAGMPEAEVAAKKTARSELLSKLAAVCKEQGSFQLATKKYTQAGDKVRAMKCLLRSGDTDKIIFFANVSRQREVYILAGNYLQSLAWQTNADLTRTIVEFYTKAKASEQLSSFFEACARTEVEEFSNYDKAGAALKEALRHAQRIKTDIREAREAALNAHIAILERFLAARDAAKVDPAGTVEACKALLETRDVDAVIRSGDVFALLADVYRAQEEWSGIAAIVRAMRDRGLQPEAFLDLRLIRDAEAKARGSPSKA